MKHFYFFLGILITTWTTVLFGSHEALLLKSPPASSVNSENIVIVSCSGKSGSSTLKSSFRAIGIETHRCHVITKDMFNYILAKEQTGNVIIIDSIRDIISRKIASFFQNLTLHIGLSIQEIQGIYKSHPKKLMRLLKQEFKQRILVLENYNTSSSWKQLDYNCLTDAEFDFNKKYQLKQIGNLYFVNLRFDDIKNWEAIIKSIGLPLDLRQFKIVPDNLAGNKWYAKIYRDFLANFTLTRYEFDTILSMFSEELAHFYTAEEIDAFIAKWTPYIQ